MNLSEAGALAEILGAARRKAVVADAIPHHPATLTWGRAQRIGNDDLTPAEIGTADVLDLYLYVQVDGMAIEVGWAIRDLIPRYLSGWFITDFDPDARDETGRRAGFPHTCARCGDHTRRVSATGLCDGYEDEDDQARKAEAARLQRARPEDMIPVPGEDEMRGDYPGGDPDAASLLPTGELMNPAHPEHDPFYEPQQIAYVVRETSGGQLRVLTSFGDLGTKWSLGTGHAIRHDQTWHPLGTWEVTGIRDYRSGLELGAVPDRPLRHWVFK